MTQFNLQELAFGIVPTKITHLKLFVKTILVVGRKDVVGILFIKYGLRKHGADGLCLTKETIKHLGVER